jgi:hypothetical protein
VLAAKAVADSARIAVRRGAIVVEEKVDSHKKLPIRALPSQRCDKLLETEAENGHAKSK